MEESIGALWIQTGKNGEFWSGHIELENGNKLNVIVFKNNKKKDTHPDFRIYKQREKQKEVKEEVQEDISDDSDLPF